MIPKIIHYTWFSGEDFPEDVKACMDTWKKVLPDYEFMLWDAKKLSEINNTFANEAVSVRKWAFASDFVRMYAVYMMILPIIQARVAERWGYDGTREHDHIQELKEGLVIYPHDFFDMPKYNSMKNVICIHRQFGGWRGINGLSSTYAKTHVRKFGIKDLLRSLLVCVNKTLHLLKLNIKII